MMKEYIGVLDSGVGGLSVLSRLNQMMPYKNYIFVGDTKNVPYGTKTPEQIYSYTKDILDFFIEKNVKNVVIACNTTSAVAYNELRENFEGKLKIFPLIQLVAPSILNNLKDNDTVAILATKATINSKKYDEEIHKINPKINVLGLDCTGFVEIVEHRLYEYKSSIDLIKSKLDIAKENNAKKIVLGCTHYPYLLNIFKNIYDVEYFDPAIVVSQIVKNEIGADNDIKGEIQFYATKNPMEFKKSAKAFFDIKDEVRLIEF